MNPENYFQDFRSYQFLIRGMVSIDLDSLDIYLIAHLLLDGGDKIV